MPGAACFYGFASAMEGQENFLADSSFIFFIQAKAGADTALLFGDWFFALPVAFFRPAARRRR
jgi:hypothetical protein